MEYFRAKVPRSKIQCMKVLDIFKLGGEYLYVLSIKTQQIFTWEFNNHMYNDIWDTLSNYRKTFQF